jgi:hypothetical protein
VKYEKCLALGIYLINSIFETIILTNFLEILRRNEIVGDNLPPVLAYLGLVIVRSLTISEFNSKKIFRGPFALAVKHILYHNNIAKVKIASQNVKRVEFLSYNILCFSVETPSLHLWINDIITIFIIII